MLRVGRRMGRCLSGGNVWINRFLLQLAVILQEFSARVRNPAFDTPVPDERLPDKCNLPERHLSDLSGLEPEI